MRNKSVSKLTNELDGYYHHCKKLWCTWTGADFTQWPVYMSTNWFRLNSPKSRAWAHPFEWSETRRNKWRDYGKQDGKQGRSQGTEDGNSFWSRPHLSLIWRRLEYLFYLSIFLSWTKGARYFNLFSPCPPFLHQPHTSNHRMQAAFEGPWIATEQGQFSEKVDHWESLASRVFGTWELDTAQRGSTRKEGNKKLPHVVPALCQQQKL